MKEKLYKCKVCLHQYREKELAQKCSDWCAAHKGCNSEIIKHAVNVKKWHIKSAIKR